MKPGKSSLQVEMGLIGPRDKSNRSGTDAKTLGSGLLSSRHRRMSRQSEIAVGIHPDVLVV